MTRLFSHLLASEESKKVSCYMGFFVVKGSVEMLGFDGGVGEGIVSQAIAGAVEAIKVFASEKGLCLMMIFKMGLWVIVVWLCCMQ